MAKDNSTFFEKTELRRRIIKAERPRMILETHGGFGRIYDACYRGMRGAVCEIKKDAAGVLAMQRPEWAVYCGESEKIIRSGLMTCFPFDFIDLDPYGEPFTILEAIVAGGLGERVRVVVNDGLRNKIKVGGAWNCGVMKEIVADFGNQLNAKYLAAAQEKTRRILDRGGFKMSGFKGYHCGHANDMTHYTFTAERKSL